MLAYKGAYGGSVWSWRLKVNALTHPISFFYLYPFCLLCIACLAIRFLCVVFFQALCREILLCQRWLGVCVIGDVQALAVQLRCTDQWAASLRWTGVCEREQQSSWLPLSPPLSLSQELWFKHALFSYFDFTSFAFFHEIKFLYLYLEQSHLLLTCTFILRP